MKPFFYALKNLSSVVWWSSVWVTSLVIHFWRALLLFVIISCTLTYLFSLWSYLIFAWASLTNVCLVRFASTRFSQYLSAFNVSCNHSDIGFAKWSSMKLSYSLLNVAYSCLTEWWTFAMSSNLECLIGVPWTTEFRSFQTFNVNSTKNPITLFRHVFHIVLFEWPGGI